MTVPEKLVSLREQLSNSNLDAWIVPSADPHQSEYVADRWKGRTWISGFTGSAGTVVITKDKAGLWTDSRYFVQAASELKDSGITLMKEGLPETLSIEDWLKQELPEGAAIGFDGAVMSITQVKALEEKLQSKHIELESKTDLLNAIWQDRPQMPVNPIILLGDEIAGESRTSKIKRIRDKMATSNAKHCILTGLDDIAWTLNIRGKDVEYNPVAYSWVVISESSTHLFIDSNKLSDEIKNKLIQDNISIHDYADFFLFLAGLEEARVLIDPDKTSQKIRDAINSACTIIEKPSIPFDLKAIKNETELKGIRDAHIRDGAAMVKWLFWLEQNIANGPHTEVTLAEKLEEFRKAGEHYQGPSFSTIAGYNGNGAIVHYEAEAETAATVKPEGMLLLDSGGQYLDGTTDITRTISLGTPTEKQKHCYTLVLKGHIDLAKAVFPKGYNGSQVDTFSRAAIWADFMNYGHGTGHGVGHFLNVHEGPQRIRPENSVPLEIGMLTSNEPGLYFEGEFGIRIENLVITKMLKRNEFGTFYGFETVTLCPIDKSLIDKEMMTKDEIEWLNNYHLQVYKALSPLLTESETMWLKDKTLAI